MAKEKKSPELDQVKNEVYSLNASLKELGDKKENQYKEKSRLEARLNKLINSANELKVKKGEIDKEISELKKKREERNKSVQSLIKDLQKLKKKQSSSKKDIGKSKDIKKQIKDLEFTVQTEVLNFTKEKSYMSKIKILKQELETINKRLGETGDVKTLRDLIKKTKESADTYHKKIQDLSKESSQIFQELTATSKEIAKTKKLRSNLRSTLKSLKDQINTVNSSLGKKLGQLGSLPLATGKAFLDGAKVGAELLHKKTEAVKEKFKKKKKLSREDILLLQREAIEKKKPSKS